MDKKELVKILEANGYSIANDFNNGVFAKKGRMEIEVNIFCETHKHWKKKFKNFIHLQTYFTKENGDCIGIYNPTHYYHVDYGFKGLQMDLDKVLEPTKENLIRLIKEIDYMQANDIHFYNEKDDSRRLEI